LDVVWLALAVLAPVDPLFDPVVPAVPGLADVPLPLPAVDWPDDCEPESLDEVSRLGRFGV
jgi:hypothetical protein